MANKLKTNEQMLRALLKDLDGIEAAILRERIVVIMEQSKKSIEANPEKWNNPIIHPNEYLKLEKKVQLHLGFSK